MMRYSIKRDRTYFQKHESIRHGLQDERKSEERRLDCLKRLLQTKVQLASSAPQRIRVA